MEIALGDSPGFFVEVTGTTDCSGEYSLAHPNDTRMLKVWPSDGHWSMMTEVASPNENIRLLSVGDTDFPWWQAIVGAKRKAVHSANGMRIGVIDVLFSQERNLQHVSFIEPERLQLAPLAPIRSNHGRQVTAILAGRGPSKYRGLASAAQFFFLDASVIEATGHISPDAIDHARVRDGIVNLAKNHRVDLINLSCGFGTHDLPDLKDAVEEAADLGTLCICAAGNSSTEPVEVPARYEETIAVGGIGFSEVADEPTFMGLWASEARQAGALGEFPSGQFGKPFLDPSAACGDEIDVLAPSMGVVIKSSGSEISDCFGTSYAAPIACSVLACALANDQIYRGLESRARYDHARRKLQEISVDLGLPGVNPGRFPVLQR